MISYYIVSSPFIGFPSSSLSSFSCPSLSLSLSSSLSIFPFLSSRPLLLFFVFLLLYLSPHYPLLPFNRRFDHFIPGHVDDRLITFLYLSFFISLCFTSIYNVLLYFTHFTYPHQMIRIILILIQIYLILFQFNN